MTGQKDRYSTQEKLWKLDDEQLTTPKHDEIVLKLLSNGESIFKEHRKPFEFSESFKVYENYKSNNTWKYNGRRYWDSSLPENNVSYRTYDSNREYKFHFDDTNIISERLADHLKKCKPQLKTLSEVLLKSKTGFPVGYLDILLETDIVKNNSQILSQYDDGDYQYILDHEISISRNQLGIEVKPTIVSFGQTLRQLNTYREYFHGKLMLCTPDIRFKDAFESQGIQVISP